MLKSYLKKNARDNFIKLVACAVVFVTASAGLGYGLYDSLRGSFEEQIHQNLADMAADNAEQVSKDMKAKIDMLQSLATIIRNSDENNISSLLWRMQELNSIYNMKRIGFVFPDGTAHTTDGFVKNLKFRRFFQQSMQGKVYIQHRFVDALGVNEPVNVISVPVSASNGSIKGVLFATYRTVNFQKITDVSIYAGKGHSSIINNNGDILTTSTKGSLANENNLFEALVRNQAGTEFIQNLLKDMSEFKIGRSELTVNNNRYIIHYQPIALGDQKWYLLTSLPAGVAYDHISPIVNKVNMFYMAAMLVFLGLSGVIIWNYAHRRNRVFTLAYTDPLTKDGNFASLKEVYAGLDHNPQYLVAMDIARFSRITIEHGRERTNFTLLEIWKLVESYMGPKDMACHMENDEFVLCLTQSSREELENQLSSIDMEIQALAKRIGVPLLQTYFGVAELKPKDNLDLRLVEAIQAKHDVKNHKGNKHEIISYYSSANSEAVKERENLLAAVPEAMEKERFEVWYQPKFCVETGKLVGAEALVRWRAEDGTLIMPSKFVRLLEKNGWIHKLDEYMFTKVCKQQREWLEQNKDICMISINISRISLFYDDVAERYSGIIKKIGLDTRYIGLEITEGSIANKDEIIEPIKRFHLQGFKLLLDDFGSEYSSLSSFYLLPIDTIKFDKSLIDHICDSTGYKLIEGMVKFIDGMQMGITMEGVETKEQVEMLKQMHCSRMDIQGYVYAEPMPAEEFASKYLQSISEEKK